MNSPKKTPTRKSPRLSGYDYSLPGGYFITIVTHRRVSLFGEIIDTKVILNATGKLVHEEWTKLPQRFPTIQLDEFINMSNHFHGILFIQEAHVGAGLVPTRRPSNYKKSQRATARVAPTLSEVIGVFKSNSARRYIKEIKDADRFPKEKRLWQRSYYDRIIRNEEELYKMREYIYNNSFRWPEDVENLEYI
jgi:putative transposase